MHAKRGRSVFLNYLVSYFSIVLLTGAIFGMAQILYFLSALNKINVQSLQNKMELIMQDMDVQWDEMTGIAMNIQINPVFNPHLTTGSKYADIERLEQFIKYNNNSVYSARYFLFYLNDDLVYRCAGLDDTKGSCMSFDYYCRYILKYGHSSDLYQQLSGIDKAQVIQLPADGGQGQFLFAFPVHTTGNRDAAGNGTLSFLVSGEDIMARIQDVSGGLNGSYALYYRDQLIAGEPLMARQENQLSIQDDNQNFRLAVDSSQNSFYQDFFQLTGLNAGILVALFLVILILAGILAYYNYKPIRTVFSKYIFTRSNRYGLPASNELKEIDQTLKGIIDSNQNMNEQLRERMLMLKSQVLRLILNGEYAPEMKNRLEMINVTLPGPYYCVLELVFRGQSGSGGLPASPGRDIMALVEELSDEDARLYTLENEDNTGLTILASLAEQDMKAEICDNILALCDAESLPAILGAGRVCRSVQTVHISRLDAQADLKHPPTAIGQQNPVSQPEGGFPLNSDNAVVDRFINAVAAGDDAALTEKLDAVEQILRQTGPSELRQKYLFADIASRLIKIAHTLNAPLNEQQISLVFLAHSVSDFMEGLTNLTQDILCQNNTSVRDDNLLVHRRAKEIQRFINEHALDYDVSLDSVAAHFSISVSGVGRLIKSVSGRNFKEYLIQLRIEEAKKLLNQTDLSVSEICKRVGYSNNSNFIKNFKREVGVTPMNFKRITEEDKSC